MAAKPTYEQLEQRLQELENEAFRLKQTEEALREREEHYKQLTEQLSDVVLTIKLGGRLSYVSPAIKGFGGYDHEKEVGNHIARYFVNKKELIKALKLVKQIYIDQKPSTIEFLFRPADRDPFYVEVTGRPLIINNKVRSIQCVMRNITERKQAEDALRESEARYSALFTGITDAVLVHHITEDGGPGQIIDANDVACKMLGYTRDEMIGMGIGDIDAPESTVDVHRVVEDLKAGRNVLFEQVHVDRDGKRIPVEVHAQTFDYQGRLAILSTVRDITGRKRAEKALRESEEKYRSMMEAMSDAAYICSPEFRVEYMNPAMIRRTGEDATGKFCHQVINALDEQCPWCRYDNVRQGESIEQEIVSPKDQRAYHVTHSPLFHEDGSVSKMTIYRDITDRIKAEEHRRLLETQLRQAQKMEAIGTLAGGIAHDFNNILSAIMGNAELALDDIPEENPAIYSVDQILRAGHRARDLVAQILAFSRQSERELKPVKVGLVVKEALKLLRPSLPSTIQIRQSITGDRDITMADPTQIHQVLLNLCANALHAMHADGGVLEIRLGSVDVDFDAAANYPDLQPGSYIKLAIGDTGHGMDANVIERIFDPYFTTKERGEGTGMGLAVVHGIMKNLGGSIMVHSEPGRGTTFNVLFPLIDKDLEIKHMTPGSIPGGSERILLVDDEETLVDMGKQILQKLGYEVDTRTSSIEALEAFRSRPDRFDLIITDMTMPNMTGDRLASELLRIRPDIPIILCTGFSEKVTEHRAKDIGVKAFIMKPMVRAEIAKIIRKVLDGKD